MPDEQLTGKSSISEYSNIRGLFGTNIRNQILVFVPALLFSDAALINEISAQSGQIVIMNNNE